MPPRTRRGTGRPFFTRVSRRARHRVEGAQGGRLAFDEARLVVVAVVDVQAARSQAGQAGDVFVERGGLGAGGNAGAVLAHVEVEQHVHALVRGGQGLRQGGGGRGVVGRDGEAAGGIGAGQPGHAAAVRPDDVVGQQHVGDAAAGQHLGLGQRGALVFRNARVQGQADDLARLVRLDVRPEPAGVAGDFDRTGDVLADQVLVEEQAGTVDVGDVGDRVSRIHGGFSGRSQVGKHVADAAGEAGNHVLAAEFVGRRQVGRAAAGAKDVDGPGGGVNHPQQAHAGAEKIHHPFVDLLGEVVGRDDLEGQVGRDPAVTAERLLVRQFAAGDEGTARLPNAGGMVREDLVAACGADDVAQGVCLDMRLEASSRGRRPRRRASIPFGFSFRRPSISSNPRRSRTRRSCGV